MKGSGRLCALAALLFACGPMARPLRALAADSTLPASAAQSAAGPCVDKVDPPNWFVGLPSPMLLVHGTNLTSAQFSVSGHASFARSQTSANGHYAFLWIDTSQTAAPAEIHIHIATSAGTTSVPFRVERRSSAPHSGFSPTDTLYLVMTDRFADANTTNDPHPSERALARGWHGGGFRGIEQHLDYLEQLGITTLWTTPVYDNDGASQAYHGYSATDLYRTDPHFGTLADLRDLAQALHQRGMKLVLDTVPNHVGPAHPWADDPPAPDWLHGTRADHSIASARFETLLDPHATWQQRHNVTDGWFANVLPDLNQENPLVRQYLMQNVLWWIEETAADGLRYDTFPYVGRSFWQALDQQLRILYPQLTTVGEVFNPDPVVASYFAGGVTHDGIDTGLTTPFDFPLHFALTAALSHHDPLPGGPVRRDNMRALETILREDWLYPHPERLVTFIGNHDTVRFLSRPGITVSDLKLAFALLATLRGTPQIYSGDEIAMRGGDDPDNRHDFPGGFPGDSQSAFTATGRTPEQAEVHDWVASLFQYRRHHPVLATSPQQDVLVEDSAFVFVRTPDLQKGCSAGSGPHFLIAVNDADHPRELSLHLDRTALQGCTRFTGQIGSSATLQASGSELTIPLAAKQAAIFEAQ